MTTPLTPEAESFKNRALSLVTQAQDDYQELKSVPLEGITKFPDGHEEAGEHVIFDGDTEIGVYRSQSRRRDELGKSIMGKYTQAQIFATLYAAEVSRG